MSVELEAGPELDSRMAQFMGWREVYGGTGVGPGEYYRLGDAVYRALDGELVLWNPSSPEGIAAAWEVLEQTKPLGWILDKGCRPGKDVSCALFFAEDWSKGVGKTLPAAICLAALAAVEKEGGE